MPKLEVIGSGVVRKDEVKVGALTIIETDVVRESVKREEGLDLAKDPLRWGELDEILGDCHSVSILDTRETISRRLTSIAGEDATEMTNHARVGHEERNDEHGNERSRPCWNLEATKAEMGLYAVAANGFVRKEGENPGAGSFDWSVRPEDEKVNGEVEGAGEGGDGYSDVSIAGDTILENTHVRESEAVSTEFRAPSRTSPEVGSRQRH